MRRTLLIALALLLGGLAAGPAAANGQWRYVWTGTSWVQEWQPGGRFDQDWPTDGAATADLPWQFEGRGDFLVFGNRDLDDGLVILAPRSENSPWAFDSPWKRWAWMHRGHDGKGFGHKKFGHKGFKGIWFEPD